MFLAITLQVRKAPQYGNTSTDHTHPSFPIETWLITLDGVENDLCYNLEEHR